MEFYLAGEITQVIDSIPWVRCASGNVFIKVEFGDQKGHLSIQHCWFKFELVGGGRRWWRGTGRSWTRRRSLMQDDVEEDEEEVVIMIVFEHDQNFCMGVFLHKLLR